ncbi:MAG: ABC transporter permease subunit [Brevinematales bacterium]|jgi:ABC-2 type transport system permease protein
MTAILKKELRVYFTSWMGYMVMGVYLIMSVVLFHLYFLGARNTSDFSSFFSDMNTVSLFIIPVLSIRLLSEDKKLGTYELLLTSPVTPWEIVLGKFASVLIFAMIADTILLIYPLILMFFTTIEWGAVFSGYLGIIFSVMLFASIGMLASSLTDNFVVAALVSFLFILLFMIVSIFANSGDNPLSPFFREISYSNHYFQFASGLIKIRDVLYFVFGAFLFLYSSRTVIESRTWK